VRRQILSERSNKKRNNVRSGLVLDKQDFELTLERETFHSLVIYKEPVFLVYIEKET